MFIIITYCDIIKIYRKEINLSILKKYMSKQELPKISWKIPEHNYEKRSKTWYIIFSTVMIALAAYSIYTKNFLFLIVVALGTVLMFTVYDKEPEMINFEIEGDGIIYNNKFYDYDEIKDFSVIYKPKQKIKQLYFVFNNSLKPRLSVPLMDENPVQVRNYLIQYLDEDLERKNEPISESINKKLKL